MQEADGVVGTPQTDAIIGGKVKRHLAVKVHPRIIGVDDAQFDLGAVIDDDWPIGQRVRAKRNERNTGQRRVQDRPASGHRISGGAGRG